MAISPYICFNGNCEEALEFYAQAFDVEKPQIIRFGDMPFKIDEEFKNRVMHAKLEVCDGVIMFSDSFKDVKVGNNISISILTPNQEVTKSYFENLSQAGQVIMELQKTEWSECYGMVVDQFGITWQLSLINTH